MDAGKSHFMGLAWASAVTVFFTLVATVVIVNWSPLIPEAIALDINPEASNEFSTYIVLHEAESWHYTAALTDQVAIAHCPR